MPVVPIPGDWDGVSWCCHVVDWPASEQWQAVLHGLVATPTRGRFWDERTGTITDVQDVGLEIYSRNLLPGGSMGCLDELQVAITCLCQAVYNTSQAGGSNGAGIATVPYETFVDDGVGTYPVGYTDRSEYEDSKCDLSRFVIDTLASDLDALKVIDVSALGATALASVIALIILTPISFVVLLSIAAAILGLAALGISTFTDAIDELVARLEAIDICEVYTTQTASEAADNIRDWLLAGTYSQQALTEAVANLLISPEAMNPLFEPKSATINYAALPAGDCSSCAIPTWWQCIDGTELYHDYTTVELHARLGGDGDYWCGCGHSPAAPVTLTAEVLTGSLTPPSSTPSFATGLEAGSGAFCGAGGGSPWDTKSSSFLLGPHVGFGTVQFRSNTDFTMRFTQS